MGEDSQLPLLPHQLLLLQPQSPPHHLRLTPQLWSVELDKWPTVHAHALASAAPLPSPTLQFKVSVLSAVSQVGPTRRPQPIMSNEEFRCHANVRTRGINSAIPNRGGPFTERFVEEEKRRFPASPLRGLTRNFTWGYIYDRLVCEDCALIVR